LAGIEVLKGQTQEKTPGKVIPKATKKLEPGLLNSLARGKAGNWLTSKRDWRQRRALLIAKRGFHCWRRNKGREPFKGKDLLELIFG